MSEAKSYADLTMPVIRKFLASRGIANIEFKALNKAALVTFAQSCFPFEVRNVRCLFVDCLLLQTVAFEEFTAKSTDIKQQTDDQVGCVNRLNCD